MITLLIDTFYPMSTETFLTFLNLYINKAEGAIIAYCVICLIVAVLFLVLYGINTWIRYKEYRLKSVKGTLPLSDASSSKHI